MVKFRRTSHEHNIMVIIVTFKSSNPQRKATRPFTFICLLKWAKTKGRFELLLRRLFQLSKFLQCMQERGLISVQEASKGVDHITSITWDNTE